MYRKERDHNDVEYKRDGRQREDRNEDKVKNWRENDGRSERRRSRSRSPVSVSHSLRALMVFASPAAPNALF